MVDEESKTINEMQGKTKADLVRTSKKCSKRIGEDLKSFAELMDNFNECVKSYRTVKNKLGKKPRKRALIVSAVRVSDDREAITKDLRDMDASIDSDLATLSKLYAAVSEYSKNDVLKEKVCAAGRDAVADFEKAKNKIKARSIDKSVFTNKDGSASEGVQKVDDILVGTPLAAMLDGTSSYRVAPVTIDISKEIHVAVDAALKKFSDTFEEKLNEYVQQFPAVLSAAENVGSSNGGSEAFRSVLEDLSNRISEISEKMNGRPTVAANDGNVALTEQICENETFLSQKLASVLESVKAVNDQMAELTALNLEIAEKQKELADLQNQTNDVQRFTLREQEGVQAGQKVINKDQIAIAEQQATLTEEQKNIYDMQMKVTESQKVTAVDQKMLFDAQTAIESAMARINQEQGNLVENQRDILKSNAQNYDAQQELAAIQVEISNAQKDFMVQNKAILRDQKALNEKQKAAMDAQNELTEELKTVSRNVKTLADSAAKIAAKMADKNA